VLLGVVSDIHCNSLALRWALDELEPAVDEILVAGDAIYEYRFSNEVIEMVRGCNARYVLGNHEMQFLRARPDIGKGTADPSHVEFMEATPARLEMMIDGKRLLMIHGVPWAPWSDYVYANSPQLSRFAEVDADIVVVGHTHIAMVERVGTTLVVNPGSVGESRGTTERYLSYAIVDTKTEEVDIRRFTSAEIEPPVDPFQ
jgi:putative phosphoesterase